jgi:Integrase core domain
LLLSDKLLEPKSRARKGPRKGPRKVTLKVTNEVRKLQENPLLGKWRMHTTLKRLGIEVSPATCARIMAANRQLYGIEKPLRSPRLKREMPFKASRRHEYWSCDVRYIEEHLLEDPRPVYVITMFENFSRMVLSSIISRTQNQWDYLMVLADVIRRYGAPEAIVTDGGGIFYAHVALELYEMLGIRKERIDPGEPWQNYAETLFSIQQGSQTKHFPTHEPGQKFSRPTEHGGRITIVSTTTPIAPARTDNTRRLRSCVGCWDERTRKRCSSEYSTPPGLPANSTDMGMSGSSNGASLEKMASPGKRSRFGCMKERSRWNTRPRCSQNIRSTFRPIIRTSKP